MTDIRHVGSEMTTGGNLTLASGGDQHYQVASLSSGDDLLINSGGAVTFEGVKDYHDESHIKSKNSAAWFSSKGKGRTDETLRQSELTATGKVVIQAVNGLQIDVKQVNQESVSQSIDAMVKADPQLTWLKDAEQRGDVDWRQVKEIHESFKYANSGLGPAAQIVVAILMAAVLGPAGLGLTGVNLAVLTTVATTATNSAISNKGDLGAVFKDVTSSDAMKGYVLSGVMAGFVPAIDPTKAGLNLDTFVTVSQRVTAEAALKTAIMGGSLKDNLGSAALSAGISIAGAKAAGKIGDSTLFEGGKITKVAMHAALGGLMAEALGGDFRTGALAAGANEAVVKYLGDKLLPAEMDQNSEAYKAGVSKLLAASQLIGALTAAATGGDASAAAEVAANGTQYNYLGHHQKAQRAAELAASEDALERLRINTKWELIDAGQDASFAGGAVVGVPEGLLDTVKGILEVSLSPKETYRALRSVLDSGDVLGNVSEAIKQSYIARIDNLEAEYERAGASGSFNAGRETGKLISEVAALGTGVGGAVKAGALLVEKFTAKVVKVELAGAKGIDDSASYAKWWDDLAQPKNLTDREARAWYLSKESEIPARINSSASLEEQAKQAFVMRNDLRSTARELMSNRTLADSLNKTDPNRTWSEIVNKYSGQGLSGDELWSKIIEKSQSSRASVNNGLGM
ncbi:DUF637 domain-containing protein [Pseudomonas sp. D4-18]